MDFVEKVVICPNEENDHLKENAIRVNQRLYKAWHLDNFHEITLICGREKLLVRPVPFSGSSRSRIECSRTLMTTLSLPPDPLPLQLTFDSDTGGLEVGPIVAMLTVTNNNHPENPLGRLTAFCKEIARYCEKQHTLFYVFSLRDWRTDCVTGLIWRNNHWEKRMLPHPHVIHNRIHSRKLEQSHPTQLFFRSLRTKGLPYFNERFLNKWEVYKALREHKEMLPYIPETALFENQDTLKKIFASTGSVFIKPVNGSLGKHIIRARYTENGFEIDYTTYENTLQQQFVSIEELWSVLSKRLNIRSFIIQVGLSLMKYKERPLDFRILCGKNSQGHWHIISTVARISPKNQFVSNVSQGAELHPVNDILKDCFSPSFANQMKRLLGELALETVELVESEASGIYGELGIDLAIDEGGHPWVIEVNTKPSKHLDPERDQTTIRPSAKTIIDYSQYLSEFTGDTR